MTREVTGTLMIVDPGLTLWGSERALAATLKDLTEAWSRVVLVTPPEAELAREVAAKPALYGPVETRTAPIGNLHKKPRIARLKALASLAGLMLRLRPARTYLNQAGLVRLMQPLTRAFGCPLTVHVRLLGDIARTAPLRGTARAPLDLIFVSDAMLTPAGTPDLPRGTAWHRAYDPYPLTPPPAPLPQAADFVSLGRLAHGKGMHLLVEALGTPPLKDARLDIFGAGVDGERYADDLAAQAAALSGRVTLHGFQPDAKDRLPAYRFMVSASEYETLGRTVMEGWEAGLVPLVYAGSGGAAEMIGASGAGLLFDDWTAESLATCLAEAHAMPAETHAALVAQGRDWMARHLSAATYRDTLKGILF